jgi:hypothetical protein
MVRASDISASSDFALERQREDLRDRRWDRRCKITLTVGKIAGASTMFAFSLLHLLG